MTKFEFLEQLKKGLSGLPASVINDYINDYEAHFSDGVAAGRGEAEVASALGDPQRLAKELRAEAGLKNWEMAKSPSSAVSAVIALIGLGALDLLIIIPLFMSLIGTLIGFFACAIGFFIVGGVVFAVGPFTPFPGGVFAALLGGIGIMALSVTLGAFVVAVSIWLVNGIVWFARLHYRLLKPAFDGASNTTI